MADAEIKEVEVLRLLPGDVIIFKSPRQLKDAEAIALKERLEEAFPENRTLILDGGCDLSVMREGNGVYLDADTLS